MVTSLDGDEGKVNSNITAGKSIGGKVPGALV